MTHSEMDPKIWIAKCTYAKPNADWPSSVIKSVTQKRLITLMTDVLGVLNLRVEVISVITTLKCTPRYVEDILLYPKALACAVCCPSSLASALTKS